ncbi:MAG: cytochrome c family protein [Bacteroidales bacterium]|nr:cytochrome c family protein [Bacteroidales bacterium]
MKKSTLSKLLLAFGLFLFIGNTAVAQNKYIGAVKCKMCHNKAEKGEQYNKWLAGPHAKAMESLKGADATNPKCTKCHSTAASVDASLHMGIKATEGVSCESCHGAGSSYKSMSVMKNKDLSKTKGLVIPTEEVCKKCHNSESPNFKGFNFKEYFAKIAHPNPLSN